MGDSTTDFSYDDYIVIAEDELTLGGAVRWIGQASFQYVHHCTLNCVECLSNDGKCYAEVVFAQKPNDTVLKKVRETFAKGVSVQGNNYSSWVVIRVLGMKAKILDDFNQYWKKDVIFLLGKDQKECYGDRNYLSAISPVFDKMFNGKFAEANKSTIELDDINSVENFKDFLLSISNERISRGTWKKMLTEGADQLECLGIQFYMELVKKLDGLGTRKYSATGGRGIEHIVFTAVAQFLNYSPTIAQFTTTGARTPPGNIKRRALAFLFDAVLTELPTRQKANNEADDDILEIINHALGGNIGLH
ncbi:BTB/POZ domain-containing protein [Ditylenchus destructor]|uniref:BTB/POZ domain-containing protein n=1 Tax=Ditylenchus destructor TaxID=166010 RepID=A0AAD4R052_9BILA|nr:BTB/POZ domain-containing protein [Ditylenchus destructor]